ncbi:MAG TPA: prepilin-type N-terminal cleavage/methylation domain-containing protein [Candidatus Sulfopaludibacter sp.]|jgi:prepilin-type N-terminal cleavage/methylation domain-containing protein|nr:prepilin-type N-terminal cleavage/methylation domain-containing protein [Candidatus Sulfopaludibacter sp.]
MYKLKSRRGFSLIELLIVIAIILIIITIAMPKLTTAKKFAQETAAIRAIQTIHTAEVQYNSQYGRYAVSLAELGPPASGAASPASADLIGNDLANGLKQGYKFTVSGNQGGYIVTAIPEIFGTTGSKTFFSDQTMTIHENDGPEPATATSKEMGTH